MIHVSTPAVPGYVIVAAHGLVGGNTIRAKHLGRDLMAGLKNIVGGELNQYTELLTEARAQAVERMLAQAAALGANAVVNVRFTTSAVTTGAAELYAYGTAVTVQPDPAAQQLRAAVQMPAPHPAQPGPHGSYPPAAPSGYPPAPPAGQTATAASWPGPSGPPA